MSRYTFGPFSLDSETRVLLRDGEPIPIGGKTLDTLLALVESRGRLLDKDELLSRVWPGVVVEEANLNQSISTVRKILGDNPKDHQYIATVAGRGYQFVAPVREAIKEKPPAAGVRVIGKRTKAAVAVAILALSLVGIIWFALRRTPKLPPN